MDTIYAWALFYIWFVTVLLILRFTPNNKIREMGNFFKKVSSLIPFSKIIDKFRELNH